MDNITEARLLALMPLAIGGLELAPDDPEDARHVVAHLGPRGAVNLAVVDLDTGARTHEQGTLIRRGEPGWQVTVQNALRAYRELVAA